MNKIDLFLQKEIQKQSRYSLLRELYERKCFSNEELLYLFPNNKLKRNGLPLKRGGSKKKKKIIRMLHDKRLFNILEDIVDDVLTSKLESNQFFNEFVDIKDIHIGEANEWCPKCDFERIYKWRTFDGKWRKLNENQRFNI